MLYVINMLLPMLRSTLYKKKKKNEASFCPIFDEKLDCDKFGSHGMYVGPKFLYPYFGFSYHMTWA